MSDPVDIAKRHTHAVVRMLLGRKMLRPGAALIAGGPVTMLKKIELARVANESRADLVHLTFDDTADGYTMTGLHICAPRDTIVYSYSDCQLCSSASGPSSCRRTAAVTSCSRRTN